MGTLNSWDVVDANNNAAPPDGWPENTMQYSEVNNTGRAVQGTMKRYFADVNGSLAAGGVADAYTLTLNETGYTAYFAGMYFACSIPANNTGAATINVNAIGVASITDRAGNALAADELEAGGIYEFRYDGVNFQLMGTVAGSINIPQAILSNSNATDLVDTDVALNVGAADPDTGIHLEITLNEIQAKADATTTSGLFINPLGGVVLVGDQNGSVPQIMNVLAGAGQIINLGLTEDGTTEMALEWNNPAGEGLIRITTPTNLLRIGTSSLDYMTFLGSGAVTMRHPATDEDIARSIAVASGGLEVNNTLTGAGFERVATTSDITAAAFDPTANQTITGDWEFDNASFGLGLGPSTELDMRNNADNSTTFIQNNGPTLQIGIAGADFGSGVFELSQSSFAYMLSPPIFIGEQAAAESDIAGDGQIWVRNDTPNTLMWRDDAGNEVQLSEVFTSTEQGHAPASGGGTTNFLRADGTWAVPPGSGGVNVSGTPANNQLAIWTNADTIEGDASLTYDSAAQQLELSHVTAGSLRIVATGTGLSDDASLLLEQTDAADGIEFVQTNDVIADYRMWRTNGAGTQGNQMAEINTTDSWAWYNANVRIMTTVPDFSGGVQVRGETNQTTALARVLIDQDDQFLEGRQPLGGFSADQIGISTVTITNSNIQDYNGHDINLTSGDTLRFGSISGGGTNEAGGILTISNGTVTIGASLISVDFWEIQPSGVTYHNLSGTSTFTASSPGIGAWRYIGTAQVVGFICAP